MIDKFTARIFICCYFLISNLMIYASEIKSVIPVPEQSWDEIKDHTFLRLATPSGKIYHVRDDLTIVNERADAMQPDNGTLTFITVAPYGAKSREVFIYLPNGDTEYHVHSEETFNSSTNNKFKLHSFTATNKKRYILNDIKNIPISLDEVPMPSDVAPVDYLEFEVGYRGESFAFTFTEDGSELIDIVNCTNYNFLMVAKGKQHSHTDGSLPYISFVDRSGWSYDIFFPANTTGFHPFMERNKSKPRNKCAKDDILLRFYGPDEKGYDIFNLTVERAVSGDYYSDKLDILTEGMFETYLVSNNGELKRKRYDFTSVDNTDTYKNEDGTPSPGEYETTTSGEYETTSPGEHLTKSHDEYGTTSSSDSDETTLSDDYDETTSSDDYDETTSSDDYDETTSSDENEIISPDEYETTPPGQYGTTSSSDYDETTSSDKNETTTTHVENETTSHDEYGTPSPGDYESRSAELKYFPPAPRKPMEPVPVGLKCLTSCV